MPFQHGILPSCVGPCFLLSDPSRILHVQEECPTLWFLWTWQATLRPMPSAPTRHMLRDALLRGSRPASFHNERGYVNGSTIRFGKSCTPDHAFGACHGVRQGATIVAKLPVPDVALNEKSNGIRASHCSPPSPCSIWCTSPMESFDK